MTPFNKPYMCGRELEYISESVRSGKISGNGLFTERCSNFFKEKYGFSHNLLTTSCTDALEMAAILLNIKEGDEIIIPSYTFVSSANPFILRGAKIVFADSCENSPQIDAQSVARLITKKTKAVVVVHYGGVCGKLDEIETLCRKNKIHLIEDAAQAINGFYKGKPLGTFGTFSTFSFHETKNIISGEGGLLVINDDSYKERAEIIWEKGTNRASFFRGEVNKYGWVDIGSSFLPSDIISAYLYAQLESLEDIQKKRCAIWDLYHEELSLKLKTLGVETSTTTHENERNGHIYYVVCRDLDERQRLIDHLKQQGIQAVFHYQSLHKSSFYRRSSTVQQDLPNSDLYSERLLRLPIFYELPLKEALRIAQAVLKFFGK